ncbi:MAG: hypothetical protein JST19_16605 [Bacteroidetes bacterium]|nr:hypothetical protein [Bacteroidota bacterium]
MKCIIATSLKEYKNDVFRIFKEAGINVYSTTDITGVKQNGSPDILQEWFATGDEKAESVVIFSFTDENKVRNVKDLVKKYNKQNETGFPIRAFIIPVEDSI